MKRSKLARRWLAGVALGMLAGAVQAQGLSWEDGLQDDAPDRYTVVKGDTLWDISGRFLQHPWQWPEVWRVNPQINNPHLIYPGDVVYLYDCDGRPCLGLERGQGIVRLSPEIRTIPHREAIEPIPLESVRHFLREHRVIADPDALDELAYVVAGNDGRLISGAGDRFYARGAVAGGGRFGIYRVGERYHDASSGELLGLELESVGEARRLRQEDDIVVMEATRTRQEIRSDDIILPLEDRALVTEFQPRAPEQEVDGRILAVPGGVRFIGRLQVVALDRGTRDGLAPGHVLAVEQRGELIQDPRTGEPLRLPGEDAGLVMVFRPYEKMSYGLVMRATRTLAVGDRLHNPRPALGTAQR
ncbi:LysM peptidoglycan-binding domain-containing protein [Halomonas organivorans]